LVFNSQLTNWLHASTSSNLLCHVCSHTGHLREQFVYIRYQGAAFGGRQFAFLVFSAVIRHGGLAERGARPGTKLPGSITESRLPQSLPTFNC
jgi:hypothetical protein